MERTEYKLVVSEFGDRFETRLVIEETDGRGTVLILGVHNDEESAYKKCEEIKESLSQAIWRE